LSEKKPNFAVDAMLGNLSKKLRILGFDSKYFSSIEDKLLIELAKKEDRVIVTKDEGLAKSAEKIGVLVVLITAGDEISQIIEIAIKIGLANFVMDTNSARCVSCNGRLESVEKSRLENKVPDEVYQRQDQFWVCVDCQKIYWTGTHFKKLQEFVARLNQRLK
jgi:uncharacterized protein